MSTLQKYEDFFKHCPNPTSELKEKFNENTKNIVCRIKENGEKMSWAEAKDDAATQITEKKAEKAEKKNSKKYNVSKNQKYNDEVKAVADDLMKNTGMTAKLATATARAQVAKSKRREAKDSKHPNLAKARGTVSKLNQARKLPEAQPIDIKLN